MSDKSLVGLTGKSLFWVYSGSEVFGRGKGSHFPGESPVAQTGDQTSGGKSGGCRRRDGEEVVGFVRVSTVSRRRERHGRRAGRDGSSTERGNEESPVTTSEKSLRRDGWVRLCLRRVVTVTREGVE